MLIFGFGQNDTIPRSQSDCWILSRLESIAASRPSNALNPTSHPESRFHHSFRPLLCSLAPGGFAGSGVVDLLTICPRNYLEIPVTPTSFFLWIWRLYSQKEPAPISNERQ